MSRLVPLSTCSALALCLGGGPAFADLTAQQVWDGMESAFAGVGYAVSATETPKSGGLDVTDVVIRFAVPEDNATVEIAMSAIEFTENADGSVSMTFPDVIPIVIDAAPDGEDRVNMVLDYANGGLDLVVSGEPGNMLYTYTADRIGLALSQLIVNGDPVARSDARFDIVLEDVSGTASTAMATGTRITQNMQVARVGYDVAVNDPDTDDAAVIAGSMSALVISSAANLPEGFDPNDPQSLAAGGFSVSGAIGYENGEMQFAATEQSGTSSGTTRTGTASLEFSMNATALRYDMRATDQALTLSGGDIPVPVDMRMASSAFNMTLPVARAQEPQDMAFGLGFRGFEMSEMLWDLFDPGAVLPRDPATIALDLTGLVTPFVNLFDPAEMARIDASGQMPAELNELTLRDLTVELAGARLDGSGSFTFDNSDLETFDGFPRPAGSIDLTLEGANALIDKLIAMGMLTSEDAMGARMAISMFARPGDGPDKLRSSLSINDQGHVLANGMRIQ